ncbi:MAG: site-2 protease family protein [Myxococcota bacterium]
MATLAREADAAEAQSDLSTALARWREIAALLPPGTGQAHEVEARIVALSTRLDAGPPSGGTGRTGYATIAAAVAGIAWKGKALLAGLAKLPTLLSMAASVGVYATLFGWQFAVGLVASLYVHEIGHVVALRRYGIAATAPMFVPGLGAFVRLNQYPATPKEDATVGLAGPVWGLGAAAVCAVGWLVTDDGLFAALARIGAWLNLFNLTPVWQLDGGRGWRALDRSQRWLATLALGGAWAWTHDPLVLVITVVAAVRASIEAAPAVGDRQVLGVYAGLVAALAALLRWLPDPAAS